MYVGEDVIWIEVHCLCIIHKPNIVFCHLHQESI